MANQVKQKNRVGKAVNQAKTGKRKKTGVDLRAWKQYLQKNDIAEIAEEIGITPQQGSHIMNGNSTNWDFAEKIIARAKRNKAIKEEAESL